MVAISEDATRIISRVEYDCETNRMVGFILPCDDTGLLLLIHSRQLHLKLLKNALKLKKCLNWHMCMWHRVFCMLYHHSAWVVLELIMYLLPQMF